MTRAGFLLARTLRRDDALMRMSLSQADLLAELRGRHVALVGNARALADKDQGARIDAADTVIRINRAPMPSARSHGTRTDWLALATRLDNADRARIAPGRILWMSPKRKRLDWTSASSDGFYLHPLDDYRALRGRFAAPPTTGAMMIELLMRSDLASLTLHGFDFFASLSLSGRRTAGQVPHDFAAERAMVETFMAQDDRLRIA
ncbi:glycosyltransferase family 29 protein [Paracoccus sp. 1_MG-2023]|uniref:glycosyltransferase family 29 protein n=1 Tax=unclassified Paracoccus (in: a-proteobacteria) TaxID=2688777 RepID=UPI001C0979D0|nr:MULTISPECIES: glycosyltransferase family 29 protein [unclassified Paracoccus (in: a-proteobacteria)]MBU2957177.1 glycosyltransferase family 29 protein [Paracoccus sp. C2R09]MDO6669064.1 glycosyltransferase family 29 protein [Paracoccus sp. 1_MG-2023]